MLFLQMRCSFDGLILVDVLDDIVDLAFAVLQAAQGLWNRLINNFQQPTADKLLVFDQCDVGLDACGIAVHHKADGARRGEYRNLRVLVAIALTLNKGVVPGSLSAVVKV
jgi:hypothetical protein